MNVWTILWLFWLALFVAIEGATLTNKTENDTLSEHIWRWFSIKEKSNGWRIRRFTLLSFLSWLLMHFLTGGEF